MNSIDFAHTTSSRAKHIATLTLALATLGGCRSSEAAPEEPAGPPAFQGTYVFGRDTRVSFDGKAGFVAVHGARTSQGAYRVTSDSILVLEDPMRGTVKLSIKQLERVRDRPAPASRSTAPRSYGAGRLGTLGEEVSPSPLLDEGAEGEPILTEGDGTALLTVAGLYGCAASALPASFAPRLQPQERESPMATGSSEGSSGIGALCDLFKRLSSDSQTPSESSQADSTSPPSDTEDAEFRREDDEKVAVAPAVAGVLTAVACLSDETCRNAVAAVGSVAAYRLSEVVDALAAISARQDGTAPPANAPSEQVQGAVADALKATRCSALGIMGDSCRPHKSERACNAAGWMCVWHKNPNRDNGGHCAQTCLMY